MTGFELHDLLTGNRELISDTWNFFLTVHLAIFGIVYIACGHIKMIERGLLVGGYLSFMYVNYMAQMDNYLNNKRILEQIWSLGPDVPDAEAAKALLGPVKQVWIMDYLGTFYICAAVVASVLIMIINRGDGR